LAIIFAGGTPATFRNEETRNTEQHRATPSNTTHFLTNQNWVRLFPLAASTRSFLHIQATKKYYFEHQC